MQTTVKGKKWTYSFTSFQDFLSEALKEYPGGFGSVETSRRPEFGGRGRHSDGFYGTATWEDAVDLAMKGWEDGRKRVERILASFATVLTRVKKPEVVFNVFGDTIDMGRYMTGEPECFQTFTDSEADTIGPKIVRVVLNGAASAMVSQEVLMLRGCAVAAVIQAIELSGRRCEVTVAFGLQNQWGGNAIGEVRVLAKEAGQPLQVDQLAFMLAHPSMLRRMLFSFLESLDEDGRKRHGVDNGSYGVPIEVADKGDIYMHEALGTDYHWKSESAAKSWVIQLLGTQNVSLTPDNDN